MQPFTRAAVFYFVAIAASSGCGDAERNASHTTCFLPADLESNRDVDACPEAWSDETVARAERSLGEDETLQNLDGPEPNVVDFEGEPWLTSCCYTVYTAGDSSWPLVSIVRTGSRRG